MFWGQGELVLSLEIFAMITIPMAIMWHLNKPFVDKYVSKTKDILVWAPIFRAAVMTYLATAIWCFTQLSAEEEEQPSPTVAAPNANRRQLTAVGLSERYPINFSFVPVILKLILIVMVPLYFKKFMTIKYRQNHDLKQNTWYLAKEIQPYKWTAQHDGDIFFGRRFVLAMTTVFMTSHTLPSMYVYFYGSLFILHYYFYNRVFFGFWINFLEMMNECFIIITGYFIFFFSEWLNDIRTRYMFGKMFNDLLIIVIILNLLGIVYEGYINLERKNRKAFFMGEWKSHLVYKRGFANKLASLYGETEDVQFNEDNFMLWSWSDLKTKSD